MNDLLAFHDPAELPRASTCDHPSDHILEAWCPHCEHEVDAVCPKCQGNVEANGNSSVTPFAAAGEVQRRVLHFLYSKRNSKFAIACFLVATGSNEADGVSMTDLGESFGVTKATVSKYCREICEHFGIPPSRYMLSEENASKFKLTNIRPHGSSSHR